MEFDSKLFNILLSFLIGGLGVKILWTQQLPIDNIKGGVVTDIGNWAYLLGGILVGYGLYILYYVIYKQNKKD